jgi:hypothetical protein
MALVLKLAGNVFLFHAVQRDNLDAKMVPATQKPIVKPSMLLLLLVILVWFVVRMVCAVNRVVIMMVLVSMLLSTV